MWGCNVSEWVEIEGAVIPHRDARHVKVDYKKRERERFCHTEMPGMLKLIIKRERGSGSVTQRCQAC